MSQQQPQPSAQPQGPPPGWSSSPGDQPQPGAPGYGAQPVVGPPPGYGPPPGHSDPSGSPAPSSSGGGSFAGSTWWALIAVAAMAVAVSVPEDGANQWKEIEVWAGFAVLAALLTLAPAARSSLNLSVERAWQVAAGGLVGLVAYWVLFVLPSISQNVSFLATISLAAGGLAVWSAPGRPSEPPSAR